jgi:hypothetical protein
MFFGQKTTTLGQDLSQKVVVFWPNVVVFCTKNINWWFLVNLIFKVVVLCY